MIFNHVGHKKVDQLSLVPSVEVFFWSYSSKIVCPPGLAWRAYLNIYKIKNNKVTNFQNFQVKQQTQTLTAVYRCNSIYVLIFYKIIFYISCTPILWLSVLHGFSSLRWCE